MSFTISHMRRYPRKRVTLKENYPTLSAARAACGHLQSTFIHMRIHGEDGMLIEKIPRREK